MKTLYFARHAKSSWDFPDLEDADRPIIEKGIRKTKKVIRLLSEKKVKPGLIITSNARRAMETARMYAIGLNYPEEFIEKNPKIYEADTDAMLSIILGLDDVLKSVFLVGHNPAITQTVNYFLKEKFDYLPTSAVVCIEFETDEWNNALDAPRKLVFHFFPKDID